MNEIMSFTQLGTLLGGIGLFLLGMRLMTNGLKVAAGPALRHILARWTRTPLRGLLSGVLITSLVQSSAAVIIATIGFVNAGLLTLLQTIYVIYGSNIGTTMTAWLVALVGLDFDIKALALPLIGLGMGLHTLFKDRRAALGEAMSGFGLFFLAIDILKNTFGNVGESIDFSQWPTDSAGLLLFVGAGFVLTFLMQSSSAALALTLTAAAGGLLPLTAAAAVVIGTNLGTTTTAALAAIGATPNAQRVAAVHVIFNFSTGVVAILLLVPLLALLAMVAQLFGLESLPATTLALFHTLFNVLGVLLLWFVTPRLVHFIEGRFRGAEEDLGRPRYLDRNIIATPALALNALVLELGHIGEIARAMASAVLSAEHQGTAQLHREQQVIIRLRETLSQYSIEMQRTQLAEDISAALPDGLRVLRYYEEMVEAAVTIGEAQQQLADVQDPRLATLIAAFRGEVVALINECDALAEGFDASRIDRRLAELEQHYQALKAALLRGGADEHITIEEMVAQLEQHSLIRRLLEQCVKGALRLLPLRQLARRYLDGKKGELTGGAESPTVADESNATARQDDGRTG